MMNSVGNNGSVIFIRDVVVYSEEQANRERETALTRSARVAQSAAEIIQNYVPDKENYFLIIERGLPSADGLNNAIIGAVKSAGFEVVPW